MPLALAAVWSAMNMPDHDGSALPDTRSRILAVAATLIAEGGVAALTTRAVAAAASVQPPTLYRLFGDKRGLLDAVAEQGLAAYVAGKAACATGNDPVQEMRDAFDGHIAFGLAHPAVFAIMNEVGRTGLPSSATLAGLAVLRERVNRIAQAGRLRVPEESAVSLIEAVGNGAVSTLLRTPEDERDSTLGQLARDVVISAIVEVDKERSQGVEAMAIGLRSHIDDLHALTSGERMLMCELLDRVAARRS